MIHGTKPLSNEEEFESRLKYSFYEFILQPLKLTKLDKTDKLD